MMAQGGYNTGSNAGVGNVGGTGAKPKSAQTRAYRDNKGNTVDLSKFVGQTGATTQLINVGGKVLPVRIAAGQADFEAVQRTIEQAIAQAMKKAK
jgi:hypothetical protein